MWSTEPLSALILNRLRDKYSSSGSKLRCKINSLMDCSLIFSNHSCPRKFWVSLLSHFQRRQYKAAPRLQGGFTSNLIVILQQNCGPHLCATGSSKVPTLSGNNRWKWHLANLKDEILSPSQFQEFCVVTIMVKTISQFGYLGFQ